MIKSVLKSSFAAFIASRCIAVYIWFLRRWGRLDIIGREGFNELLSQEKGMIVVFWHQRLLLSTLLVPMADRPVHMLISRHRDGEIIARGARHTNLSFIRGSAANPKKAFKNKSGTSAILAMLDVLKKGEIVGMTPDGPRGPAQVAQHGVLRLASKSGAPIVPAGLSARSGFHLRTWDSFFLVNPFARKVAIAGEALFVPKNASEDDINALAGELDRRLQQASEIADKTVGKSLHSGHNAA